MGGVHKNAGIYRLKDAFRLAMYQVHPLNDCVTRITIKNTNSQMFLCSPWENILRWANRVGDRYLPYGDAEHKGGSPIGSRVKRLAQLELALAPIRTGYCLTLKSVGLAAKAVFLQSYACRKREGLKDLSF